MAVVLGIVVYGVGGRVQTAPQDHVSPKLVNYYLGWDLTESIAKDLATWDVVVLDMEVQARTPELLRKMKQWNPDITLLVYITPQEIHKDTRVTGGTLRQTLAAGLSDDWYLKDSAGNKLSWWSGTYIFNVTDQAPVKNGKTLQTYMADFVVDELLSSGYWDGVFYDNSWDNITYFVGNDVDIDRDGVSDSDANAKWVEGMKAIYNRTRARGGNDIYIVGNSTARVYYNELNGSMVENFSSTNWAQRMQEVADFAQNYRSPQLILVNANTANTGRQSYKQMRFGLGSALLEDAYFSYDFGDQRHEQTWQFDEYDINLGSPIGSAVSQKGLSDYGADVWRRDFANGVVVLNSQSRGTQVELGGEFEKLRGTQDPTVNDGAIVSEVSLNGYDALLLLKTFEGLEDVLFTNGSFARFFRPEGDRVRNGFFVFDDRYKGGAEIGLIDLDNNGKKDLIVVTGNKLEAWRDDGQRFMKKYPYTVNYPGKLRVATGDLNEDGLFEVYVAPEPGQALPIKVYTRHGRQMKRDWYPFGEGYAGGYTLAVRHQDGRRNNELVIGTGANSSPAVRIFDRHYDFITEWAPFDSSVRGGVNVATGDLDADGSEEIVVGAGEGSGPRVRVYGARGGLLYSEFTAYSSFTQPGVDVRAVDVDFDGKDDIVTLSDGF